MKNLFAFFICIWLVVFSGCKKKESPIPPTTTADAVSVTQDSIPTLPATPIQPATDSVTTLQTTVTAPPPAPIPAPQPPENLVPIPVEPAPKPAPVPAPVKEAPAPTPAPTPPPAPKKAENYNELWAWVPIFPGAEVEFRSDMTSQYAKGALLEKKNFFKTEFAKLGWEIVDFGNEDGAETVLVISKGEKKFKVGVSRDPGGRVRIDVY